MVLKSLPSSVVWPVIRGVGNGRSPGAAFLFVLWKAVCPPSSHDRWPVYLSLFVGEMEMSFVKPRPDGKESVAIGCCQGLIGRALDCTHEALPIRTHRRLHLVRIMPLFRTCFSADLVRKVTGGVNLRVALRSTEQLDLQKGRATTPLAADVGSHGHGGSAVGRLGGFGVSVTVGTAQRGPARSCRRRRRRGGRRRVRKHGIRL